MHAGEGRTICFDKAPEEKIHRLSDLRRQLCYPGLCAPAQLSSPPPDLPLGDLVWPSLRPGRARSPRGRLRSSECELASAVLSPTALSPRPPSTSFWPRSPPHWWQPSSSETASEAAYASFAAAARRMSEGRLRPRSVAAALQSAHGGGGAGGSDKQAARPRPAPVTPLPGGRARQCWPVGDS